ncbi:MAG TPA: hypothetical protein VFO18_10505 [Methylomirabilota bacterium]|nr:hypothetical protein [Methylomirabilota bacterium]
MRGRLVVNLALLLGLLWVLTWLGLPWWVAVVVLLLAPYWLGPIAVRLATRHPAQPTFEPYDASRHRVPDWALAFADHMAAALGRVGFASAARFVESTWARHVTSFVTVLLNVQSRDAAMVAAIYTTQAPTARRVGYAEFTAKLADGRRLVTNNNATPSVYPPVPSKVVTQVPLVSDPARLHRVHEALVGRVGSAKEPLPADADMVGRLSDAMTRTMQEQIETGYMYFDADARVYRPTWKGAVLMSWKLLPPFREIRRRRLTRRAQRLLDELHA